MSSTERYLFIAVAILTALLFWQLHREDQLIERFNLERALMKTERIRL